MGGGSTRQKRRDEGDGGRWGVKWPTKSSRGENFAAKASESTTSTGNSSAGEPPGGRKNISHTKVPFGWPI